MDKCYSINREDFNDELQDCENQLGPEAKEGDIITAYEGECIPFTAVPDLIDVGDIIETVQDRAHDKGGEHAESYLDNVTTEAKGELHALLVGWFEKHKLEPTFWGVKNIKPIKVKLLADGYLEPVPEQSIRGGQ